MYKTSFLLALIGLLSAPALQAQQAPPLRLLQIVPLPGIHGRIDHFDVDLKGHRLFMSALGNNSLEVFDLRSNRLIHTLRGFEEPQGVTYVPRSNRIFVANGGDGSVRIFDGSTYKLANVVRFPSDADDTRYDAAANHVFVGYGSGDHAGLGILDGATGRLLQTIQLPGHPESFQLEERGPMIFVNIPTAGNIVAVVNRRERKIVAKWALGGAQDNFPMALDEKHHRVFITCRRPPEVLVLDTESGKIVAKVPCAGEADDAWYDETRKRIYVSGGAGSISVIQQDDMDHYRTLAQMRTQPGGRTSYFAPQLHRLYLGIWGRQGHPEELRVYEIRQ